MRRLLTTGDAPPIEPGVDTHNTNDVPASMFQELRSLGLEDVKTPREVMKNKASGEIMEDKTYLMERVI